MGASERRGRIFVIHAPALRLMNGCFTLLYDVRGA